MLLKRSLLRHNRRKQKLPKMVSSHVYNLCHGNRTVSSELAEDPTRASYKTFKELYEGESSEKSADHTSDEEDLESDELRKAKECGNWGGAEPSKLFLRVVFLCL
jgi:hypothetical protein